MTQRMMSAVHRPRTEPSRLLPLAADRLDALMAIEVQAYAFPWTRGNFIDSMVAGYLARVLVADHDDALLGYFVAMAGVDEMHLLNLTVDPAHQGRGHARTLLQALYGLAVQAGARALWLEVRESNARAQALYLAQGFHRAGRRRGYYPAAMNQREDAILMTLDLSQGAPHGLD